jgi:hypothetical protein
MATSNYSWNLPTVGGSEDTWGASLNANWTALDTLLGGTNSTEFAILDGATVTTTISHADTSSQGSVINSGTTFIQSITLDTYGHITALTSAGVPGASAPTTAQVLAAYAGAGAREVGTYTLAWYALNAPGNLGNGASIAVGTVVSGASLRVGTSTTSTNTTFYPPPAEPRSGGSFSFETSNTVTLPGTWRLMTSGSYNRYINDDPSSTAWYSHLWLRIS